MNDLIFVSVLNKMYKTQTFISSALTLYPKTNHISKCMLEISIQMSKKHLNPNQSKTELLFFSISSQSSPPSFPHVNK